MAICPICECDQLDEEPWADGTGSQEICPSCGVQFGYDDTCGGDEDRRREFHERRRRRVADRWIDRALTADLLDPSGCAMPARTHPVVASHNARPTTREPARCTTAIAQRLSHNVVGPSPLERPQSAALGPEILITDQPMSGSTEISLLIERAGACVFEGTTEVSKINRSMAELVDYLTREATFPDGCFLMTGTGVVQESDFSLRRGDSISISIDGIGTLTNPVA